jgi:hypothetical protein
MPNDTRISDDILWHCLRNRRPDKSKAIESLVAELSSVGDSVGAVVTRDKAGNLWIDLRGARPIGTMFQAHLDDVSRAEGQTEIFWGDAKVISTDGKSILGADDGAGCAMLAHLIANAVPALYLFTQGEEIGGVGGGYAARSEYHRVQGIERCIAFDRRGTTEICGAQWRGDLASAAFVDALSDALGMGHVWGQGSYTDNSEWQGVIPEIVNVSVGYQSEHTPQETLDYAYFSALRAAVAAVDWESLPTIGPAKAITECSDAAWRPGDWEYAGSDDSAITEALWDIADTFGISERDIEYGIVREILARMARALRSETYV